MTKPVIVGFVSQKGGTGKSTLARALAAVVAHAGLKIKVADLDNQQQTVLEWEKLRDEARAEPPIVVEGFDTASEALASAEDDELLIVDAPAHANRGTLEIANAATLIVQPTGRASMICGQPFSYSMNLCELAFHATASLWRSLAFFRMLRKRAPAPTSRRRAMTCFRVTCLSALPTARRTTADMR